MTDKELIELSERNMLTAQGILKESGLVTLWESIGAKVNTVGSLAARVMMTHRDIDLHIYTERVDLQESFGVMARFVEDPGVGTVWFRNLIDTEEECVEWHAAYTTPDGEEWSIDMIHIRAGSFFDGYAEKVADYLREAMTPAMRMTILRLKAETPPEEKIMGIEYYLAVVRDGVTDYASFEAWRRDNPVEGVITWVPQG